MLKIVSILLLLSISVFGDFYYYKGKKQSLTPEKTRSINDNIKYYRTQNGNRIGVNDKIIVCFNDLNKTKTIEKKFDLILVKKLDSNMFLYKTSKKDSLKIANEISLQKGVKFAHPDFLIQKQKRVLDPFYSKSWHLKNNGNTIEGIYMKKGADINIEEAWKITKGKGINIAIFDDGIDIYHEDLKDGIVEFENYEDFFTNDPSPTWYDGNWHGTSVAGLVGARENGKGGIGVAPKANLFAMKIPSQSISKTIESFNWAYEKKVDIIINSWGTYESLDAYEEIFKKLATKGRDGKGILIFFAAGNENSNLDSFGINDESESPYVLSIVASTESDELASYNNYGSSIDFAAPGGEYGVVTTDVTGTLGYTDTNYLDFFKGTSAATPIAAGVAALVLSTNPNLTRKDVIDILKKSSKKLGNIPYNGIGIDKRNNYWGYGRVDAAAAVKIAYELSQTASELKQKSQSTKFKNFAYKIFKSIY